MPRYDFYVDEDKQNRRLGVLAVSNAVALNQVLENVRDQYQMRREIKWNEIDRIRLPVAVSWVRVAAWFHALKFACLPWPDQRSKGTVLVEFFRRFLEENGATRLEGVFDSVAFLDFDNVDKKGNLHRFVAHRANILRCYPLDSKASNCLQLADTLLGSWVRSGEKPIHVPRDLYSRWPNVDLVLKDHKKLSIPAFTGAESRRYLAGYASRKIKTMLITLKEGERGEYGRKARSPFYKVWA